MFFNKCINHGNSPFVLKHANIMPVFNKGYRGSVDNLKTIMYANNPFYGSIYI